MMRRAKGEVAARAYLITTEQFVDVLAQETRRPPGMTLDLEPLFQGDSYSTGVGGYRSWSESVSVARCRS